MSNAPNLTRGRAYEQVYEYVKSYLLLKCVSPTLEEIAQNFGVHRVTAHQHVKRLVGLGLIAKNGKNTRQLELTDPDLRKILEERQKVIEGGVPPWGSVPEPCTIEALREYFDELQMVQMDSARLNRAANEMCAKQYTMKAWDFTGAVHKMCAAVGTEAFMSTLERVAGYHQRIVELGEQESRTRTAIRHKQEALAKKVYLRATEIELSRIQELRHVFKAAQAAALALETMLIDARKCAQNSGLRECERLLLRDEYESGDPAHLSRPLRIPTHIDTVIAGRVSRDVYDKTAGWRSAWVAQTYDGMTRKKAFLRRVKKFVWKDTCMDCHRVFSNVEVQAGLLEFDHLPVFNKKKGVPALAGSSADMLELKNEIRKCDLVCKNCHAMRTWIRHKDPDFVRPSPTPPPSPRSGPTTA